MAQSKKMQHDNLPVKSHRRDRKRGASKRMRVSGKSTFTLARLIGSPRDSKKNH